ncbi:MAG TPA: hypothetical protein VMT69_16560 [Kineosporiaceae bacterium]|nr:hypothetical protein [Kineosporiaceae bacterium]
MTASTHPPSTRALRRRPARADLLVHHVRPQPVPAVHRLPNLLLAGVSHADASGLTAGLGRHPQVCLPSTRRIDHFTPLRYGRRVDAPLEDYDLHFARWAGERYRLETSPVYFDGGATLVAEVAACLPDVRVVLLLRDPAQRLWTSFTDKMRRGRLPAAMPYDTFVDRCLALRASGSDRFEGNRYFRTLSSGFYVEHLPAWLQAFGSRARVVFAEHLAEEAAHEVTDLLRWLGLDPEILEPSVEPERCGDGETAVARSTFACAIGRLWPLAQRAGAPQRPDPVDERLGTPRQGERQRNRVRALYASSNRQLAALLRAQGYTRLPDWLLDA